MDGIKPWYLSRTIWASLVAAMGALASMAGYPAETLDQASLADAILQAVTAVAGIVAIVGRIFATSKIG